MTQNEAKSLTIRPFFFFPKNLSLISTTQSIPYDLFSRENISWKFMENEVFNVSSESVTAIN